HFRIILINFQVLRSPSIWPLPIFERKGLPMTLPLPWESLLLQNRSKPKIFQNILLWASFPWTEASNPSKVPCQSRSRQNRKGLKVLFFPNKMLGRQQL